MRRRLDDSTFRSDPNKPRDEKLAVELILEEAEVEFEDAEELNNEFIRSAFLDKINETIRATPQYAYELGQAVVANAMNQAKEGTEQGRADALSDLRTSFEFELGAVPAEYSGVTDKRIGSARTDRLVS